MRLWRLDTSSLSLLTLVLVNVLPKFVLFISQMDNNKNLRGEKQAISAPPSNSFEYLIICFNCLSMEDNTYVGEQFD
ncbi:MAG TPA: hypothetical protein DCZ00_05470 [Lactococcus sp.]|nr:hypothetical protein [Lactococcus sp.]HBC90878.1 hypothetical protein [Lactococcus sp.]